MTLLQEIIIIMVQIKSSQPEQGTTSQTAKVLTPDQVIGISQKKQRLCLVFFSSSEKGKLLLGAFRGNRPLSEFHNGSAFVLQRVKIPLDMTCQRKFLEAFIDPVSGHESLGALPGKARRHQSRRIGAEDETLVLARHTLFGCL